MEEVWIFYGWTAVGNSVHGWSVRKGWLGTRELALHPSICSSLGMRVNPDKSSIVSTRRGNETTGVLLLLSLFGDKELGVSLKRGGRRVILWGSSGWIFMLCWGEMADNIPFTSSLGKSSLNERDWIEKVCLTVRRFCWCFQNVAWIRPPICWVLRTFVASNFHSE